MKKNVINITCDISIEIIMITNNKFLALGVDAFLQQCDIGTCKERRYSTISECIFIVCDTQQAIDFVDSSFHQRWNRIQKTIFIVDHDLMPGLSLHLCHLNHGNIFVISENEINFDKIQQLIFGDNIKRAAHIDTPTYSMLSQLTYREKRVCNYLYLGYKSKFIGLLLGINEKSVYGYKTRIMKKIGCRRKSDFNRAILNYNRFCRNNYD